MNIKRFEHLISLGMNCEIAFQLNRIFKYVESSLLTWTGVHHDHLHEVLQNPNLIFSGGIKDLPAINMFCCLKTNFSFHGKTPISDMPASDSDEFAKFIATERQDVIERIKHLADKFNKQAHDSSSKLYILGIHPQFYREQSEKLDKYLADIADIIHEQYCNAAVLFIIPSKYEQCKFQLCSNCGNAWLRRIEHFAPYDKATFTEYMDIAAYDNIFAEFQPSSQKQSAKVYKFQK